MTVKLLTENHLEFLSLKGGWTGSFESTHVKMPHCWKSHAAAHVQYLTVSKNYSANCTYVLCRNIIWASSQENLSSGFQAKPVSNQPPQLQWLARKLKFHLYQVYIRYFPKSEKQRRWSVFADAQAGLRLCCLQTPEDRYITLNDPHNGS